MKVYIAQLLCPSRHCILAAAGEYASEADAQVLAAAVRENFQSATEHGILDPWCGLCKSRKLAVEVRATRFTSLEEAQPHLSANQTAQLLSAEYIRRSDNN